MAVVFVSRLLTSNLTLQAQAPSHKAIFRKGSFRNLFQSTDLTHTHTQDSSTYAQRCMAFKGRDRDAFPVSQARKVKRLGASSARYNGKRARGGGGRLFKMRVFPPPPLPPFPPFLPFLLSSNLFKGEKCNISVNPLLQREGKRKPALFSFLFSRKGLLQRKRLLLCFLLSFSGADASAPRCYLDANFLCSFPFLSSGVRRRRRAEMGLFFFPLSKRGKKGRRTKKATSEEASSSPPI